MIQLPLYVFYLRENYYLHCSLVKMAEACFLLFIQLFSLKKKSSILYFSPAMYVEICGTDRCNYCFAVCCSLGTCSVQRSCPCHMPSMSVSDPLPFCQTVLSAPFLCWSEPVSSEVMWLCVLSAVCGAILEFPHGLQALFTLSSAALQHLLITACFVCHM